MKYLFILIGFLLVYSSYAQDRGTAKLVEVPLERRMAFVMGVSKYQHTLTLKNPTNDADSMEVALTKVGFTVTKITNKTLAESILAYEAFLARLRPGDVVVFFFSGHGIGYRGDNYLLPTNAKVACLEEIPVYCLSSNLIQADLRGKQVRNSFIILDACRSLGELTICNPMYRDVAIGQGLVVPKGQLPGSVVVFATQAGKVALDNETKSNGLFTQELLKHLTKPNLTFQQILTQTALGVVEESKKLNPYKLQEPTSYGLLGLDFKFLVQQQADPVEEFRKREADYQAEIARLRAEKENTSVRPEPVTPTTRAFLDLPFAEMAFVPGGTFQMGDTRGEGEANEKPVHEVTVSGFWMGKYEITQRQWEEMMGSNPSSFKNCPDCPVETVSWEDVQEFLKKLNARTGGRYRLPTEAEWEYAAGGGSGVRTRFGNGQDVADPREINFDGRKEYTRPYSVAGEYRGKPVTVGSFSPNKLGLFNMSGNVWEWCSDWYGKEYYASASATNPTGPSSGTYGSRVLRGGSWLHSPQFSRVALRNNSAPSLRYDFVGFRVVAPQ